VNHRCFVWNEDLTAGWNQHVQCKCPLIFICFMKDTFLKDIGVLMTFLTIWVQLRLVDIKDAIVLLTLIYYNVGVFCFFPILENKCVCSPDKSTVYFFHGMSQVLRTSASLSLYECTKELFKSDNLSLLLKLFWNLWLVMESFTLCRVTNLLQCLI